MKIQGQPLGTVVARWYILLLPVRMLGPFAGINGAVGYVAVYLDFILHVLGLTLLLVERSHSSSGTMVGPKPSLTIGLFRTLLVVFTILSTISIIMAIVMQLLYGDHGSESALQGVAGNFVYFAQYLVIIFYNWRAFSRLRIGEVHSILIIQVTALVGLGLLQVLAIFWVGTSAALDHLDPFGFLPWSFSRVAELGRVSLSGPEPAAAGLFLGILVLPFLFANLLYGVSRKFSIVALILSIVILYHTKSTTAYLLAAADIVVWVMLLLKQHQVSLRRSYAKAGAICALLSLIVLGIWVGPTLPTTGDLSYLIVQKPFDLENQSTVVRTIMLPVNFSVFAAFPILGVGNGNQGYFYQEFFPDWAIHSPVVPELLARAETEIFSGALFVPSLFSGYGLVGVMAVVFYLQRARRVVRAKRVGLGPFYYMYPISAVAFLIAGFQGDFVGDYLSWFPMSIPFMSATVAECTVKREGVRDGLQIR